MPVIISFNIKSGNYMKKILLLATINCYTYIASYAQQDHSSHQKQDTLSKTDGNNKVTAGAESSQKQFATLLSLYYNIKNALVAGDSKSAASNADLFLKTANSLDYKVVSEGNVHILSKNAGKISATTDLKKQREFLADLSTNMEAVVKMVKLGDEPIYVQYCPMKKATWLSSEKQIKNPYYGSSMLTCGEVKRKL